MKNININSANIKGKYVETESKNVKFLLENKGADQKEKKVSFPSLFNLSAEKFFPPKSEG